MSQALAHRIFNVEEYYRMQQAGILNEDDRVELIDGEIVQMSPISSRHAACVNALLNGLISLQTAKKALLSVQNPVRLGPRSEPQPDIAVLRPRSDFYAKGHPEPGDIILVVEVSDTSAKYDRETKVPLYARSGIRESWIVDLEAGVIEVFRDPVGESYSLVFRVAPGERLAPPAFPDFTVDVADLLK